MDGASLRAAVAGGLVSAVVIGAIFLAAGAFEDPPDRPAVRVVTTPAPAVAPVGDVYRAARLSVVLVDNRPPGVPARTGPPVNGDRIASGAGFLVDDAGHIVTNQHIVDGRGTTTVQFRAGRNSVTASVVARDPSNDLAIVRVDRADAGRLRALALGDSGAVRGGRHGDRDRQPVRAGALTERRRGLGRRTQH